MANDTIMRSMCEIQDFNNALKLDSAQKCVQAATELQVLLVTPRTMFNQKSVGDFTQVTLIMGWQRSLGGTGNESITGGG